MRASADGACCPASLSPASVCLRCSSDLVECQQRLNDLVVGHLAFEEHLAHALDERLSQAARAVHRVVRTAAAAASGGHSELEPSERATQRKSARPVGQSAAERSARSSEIRERQTRLACGQRTRPTAPVDWTHWSEQARPLHRPPGVELTTQAHVQGSSGLGDCAVFGPQKSELCTPGKKM